MGQTITTDSGFSFDAEQLSSQWSSLTADQKRQAILALRRVTRESRAEEEDRAAGIPTNDDELHEFIKRRTGFDIPRVAVCPDHQAPFAFMADGYFNRSRAILVLGSREGGKTLGVAILHYVNAETKPGIEACTFGAIEAQANRAYKHLRSFIYMRNEENEKVLKPGITETKRKETTWDSGAIVEIIIGSKSGVNSPHPNVVHADEVDLMEQEVWDESRNMSSSSNPYGKRLPALDIATSTRKSMKGPMQTLINEVMKARKEGHTPAWDLHAFCIFEVAAEVPNCRAAPDGMRELRLSELGMDPCSLCDCHTNVKGEWDEKTPRTLESVCRGRFFKSRGWMHRDDVVGKFMQNGQVVWDAQQECRRPETEGLYLPTWGRTRFGLGLWVPKPEHGFIWMGVDWGGSAPSYVTWIQGPLHRSVEAISFASGQKVVVPAGAYVHFDEISEADIGAVPLANLVINREIQYRNKYGSTWRVRGRFADMAGKQQRDDWRQNNPPLRTVWYIDRAFDPMVENLQDLSRDGLLYVDCKRAPGLADDYESWRKEKGKEVHDASSHGPAASRYAISNVKFIMRRVARAATDGQTAAPLVAQRASSPELATVGSAGVDTEQWRGNFGFQPNSPGARNPGVIPTWPQT